MTTPTQIASKIIDGCNSDEGYICGEHYKNGVFYCNICKSKILAYKTTWTNELEFLEHEINPNQCGCDRCPSCRIMQNGRIANLKEAIKILDGGQA